jgi:hypothetical protein
MTDCKTSRSGNGLKPQSIENNPNYADLFPKHRLDQDKFVTILEELQKNRDSKQVVTYWNTLDNEGNMFNILQTFSSQEIQNKIKSLIYSFAEFMTKEDFVEFKKMLCIHGHILEFVHAILNKPEPNYGIVSYFVMVAKAPRHYDPQIIKWFWEKVVPLIEHDDEMKQQFLENCSNSIHRWIITQKRNKNYRNQQHKQRYITFGDEEIPVKLIAQTRKPTDTKSWRKH